MELSWLSLLPPLIVVFGALVVKNINKALFIGILSAAFIATQFSVLDSAQLMSLRLYEQITDIEKIYLYLFLFTVATLVALYNYTGCVNTFAHIITKMVRSARTIQTSSLLLSFTLFIDDYLSILTTGFVMSPLIDRFAIPRQKLAFLVHSLAGSVVILAPVSSWVAAITAYLSEVGVDTNHAENIQILADPFFIYLKSIPFMFYSFLIISSVWFIVRKNISFGPMHQLERTVKNSVKSTTNEVNKSTIGTVADLLIPLVVLLSSTFIGLLYTGGYHLLGGSYSFIEAIKKSNHVFLVMCIAALVALAAGLILSIMHRTLTVQYIPHIFIGGIKLMYSAVLMVFLASTLGIMLKDDLYTGQYLAHLLLGAIPISLLPFMFFVVSLLTTLATGGAWATFALMLAIAIPMITSLLQVALPANPEALPILFPILGAIFSGAVCGDHISPFSETTIMTATSTHTTPMDHAWTQVFYALPAVVCSALAFILSGYLISYSTWLNLLLSLGISIGLCFSILALLNKNK